jgi:hypothetical protein
MKTEVTAMSKMKTWQVYQLPEMDGRLLMMYGTETQIYCPVCEKALGRWNSKQMDRNSVGLCISLSCGFECGVVVCRTCKAHQPEVLPHALHEGLMMVHGPCDGHTYKPGGKTDYRYN